MTEPERFRPLPSADLAVTRKMLTLAEAAASLGVQPATLRQQIANTRLKARKAGRDWRLNRAEVERYRLESLGQPGHRPKMKEGRSLPKAARGAGDVRPHAGPTPATGAVSEPPR